jgi:CRP/FNR family cyclic AMP-dependent transcriptional regulator
MRPGRPSFTMAAVSAPVDLIKRVPLFERLGDRELNTLAATFTERSFQSGQALTTEGQGAAGFFVIESGSADVTVAGAERRTLGPGDYYGEIALLDGGARTATITATSDGKSYGLTSWQFRPLVEEHASIAWPLLEALAARIRQIEAR